MVIATVKFSDVHTGLNVHRAQKRVEQVPVANPEQRLARREASLGRYSSRCTYHKIQYTYTYCSFAAVKRGGKTLIYTGPNRKQITHKATADWRFAVDDKGLSLQHRTHRKHDYRVDAEYLVTAIAFAEFCHRVQRWCDADHPATVATKTYIVATVAENFEIIAIDSDYAACENAVIKFFSDNEIAEDDGETIYTIDASEANLELLNAAELELSDKTDDESREHLATIRAEIASYSDR